MIAVSIVYVAVENLVTTDLKPWRVALVFSFGLLHGMGFAGVLRDVGLPRQQFLTALLAFNAGVEGGQLTVIAIAFAAVAYGAATDSWTGGSSCSRPHSRYPSSDCSGRCSACWGETVLHLTSTRTLAP